jgi:hypothetical protein
MQASTERGRSNENSWFGCSSRSMPNTSLIHVLWYNTAKLMKSKNLFYLHGCRAKRGHPTKRALRCNGWCRGREYPFFHLKRATRYRKTTCPIGTLNLTVFVCSIRSLITNVGHFTFLQIYLFCRICNLFFSCRFTHFNPYLFCFRI